MLTKAPATAMTGRLQVDEQLRVHGRAHIQLLSEPSL
jgi:hypothetical protein